MKALTLNAAEFDAIERELCKRSFADFIRLAWPNIIPDKLIWGWHIDAIAQHLEAVARGDIKRLLINVPPGTSKSTITGVMYPAWLWGPAGQPWHRYIGAAHEQGLAVRDNRLMREIVTSPWYQRLWPLRLQGDQNEKLYFENERRGFRQACAVASMTGRRGHTIAWDDPLSPQKADSPARREEAIRILTETVPTRLNEPDKSAIIVIMQRLHEDDPSGYILSHDLGYEHLLIPMEWEPERRVTTSIGWTDPRKSDGELLDPVRFPQNVIDRDKKAMGAYAWAGQMQQRPAPRGGGLFKREWFQTIPALPVGCRMVRGWDLAATESKTAAATAGVLLARAPDGRIIIVDVVREQVSPAGVERLLRATADQDRATYGPGLRGSIPQDPGQSGKSQTAHLLKTVLAGHSYFASPESGDKETRALPLAAQAEAGNVFMLPGRWNQAFLDEIALFPLGKFKDQVDAASRAYGEIVTTSSGKVQVKELRI